MNKEREESTNTFLFFQLFNQLLYHSKIYDDAILDSKNSKELFKNSVVLINFILCSDKISMRVTRERQQRGKKI